MEHSILYIIFGLTTFVLVIWGAILSGDDVNLAEFIGVLILSFIPVINVVLMFVGILSIFERMDKIIVFKGRK